MTRVHIEGDMERRNQPGWFRANASLMLSTAVILAGMFIAWGKTAADVGHIRDDQLKLEARIVMLEGAMRAHHEDMTRHIDPQFRAELRLELTEIKKLIVDHMNSTMAYFQKNPNTHRQ